MHIAVNNSGRLKDVVNAIAKQRELKRDECVLQMEIAREALWPMVKKSFEKAGRNRNVIFLKQEEDLHALRMEVAFLKSKTTKQALTIHQHSLQFNKVVSDNRELRRRVEKGKILIRLVLLTKYRYQMREHTYKQKDDAMQSAVNNLGNPQDQQGAINHEQIQKQYMAQVEKVLAKDMEQIRKDVQAKNQEHENWLKEWLKQKDEISE
jgi:hypothetical protein